MDVHTLGSAKAQESLVCVGADLANIVNKSALPAARRGAVCVSRDDILQAVERAKVSFEDRQQHQGFSEQERN
ncbi:hypothetical protein Hanom_Chr16g01521751 [Helianthus anomalus]